MGELLIELSVHAHQLLLERYLCGHERVANLLRSRRSCLLGGERELRLILLVDLCHGCTHSCLHLLVLGFFRMFKLVLGSGGRQAIHVLEPCGVHIFKLTRRGTQLESSLCFNFLDCIHHSLLHFFRPLDLRKLRFLLEVRCSVLHDCIHARLSLPAEVGAPHVLCLLQHLAATLGLFLCSPQHPFDLAGSPQRSISGQKSFFALFLRLIDRVSFCTHVVKSMPTGLCLCGDNRLHPYRLGLVVLDLPFVGFDLDNPQLRDEPRLQGGHLLFVLFLKRHPLLQHRLLQCVDAEAIGIL
mmetsp:Transcript_14180/g.42129  ORF Transcript_14180/g.42129 Transcript_14180/m.42129 type:complete len:298 (-) Transcript_14180:940-1833(-)